MSSDDQNNLVDLPVVLVIGAVSDIGSAVASRLKASGVQLALADSNESALALLADGLDAVYYVLDGGGCSDLASCMARVWDKFGRLDGVAHCHPSALFHKCSN